MFYTASPVRLKYRTLGDATVAVVFGPLLVGYYTVAMNGYDEVGWGSWLTGLITLLPITMLTVGILHGNNLRDIKGEDRKSVV